MTKIGASWRGHLGVSTRTERYRYTVWPDGREELYDHEADPQELKNLAGDPKYAMVVDEICTFRHVVEIKRPTAVGVRRG